MMKNEESPLTSRGNLPPYEPIAIIGMSCRFPQAPTLHDFWELLRSGKDTVTEIPADRWDITDYYDPDPAANRKTNQKHGALLKDIHDFDPFFFGISPAEATDMSPSQKLMLELVWEAIENSTVPFDSIRGQKVGVYAGNIWSDFEHLRKQKNAVVTSHSAIGQSANIIANRVSFVYGFTGPSLVVDTGCSSSLVALHLACQGLWDNSIAMAVVSGINHILDPDQYVLLSKFGGLSSKGKCSTFDAEADGFVRGEGAGVLLLKKLAQAEADGDKIYALIRGTAVNNNGFNVNLPATSTEGQKQMLHDAYQHSGIAPHQVHYVEAHGTGTRVGDPTEARALGEFFGYQREGKLHVGSVKTNVGHLEAAAGIAGLIKVVLAMQHRALPPNLNFKNPNPDIPFGTLKLKVQNELSPWPAAPGETLKAGINSFGWGGTNAHTVLEEYVKPQPHHHTLPPVSRYCLPISAKSPAALKDYVKLYHKAITHASADTFHELCIATALCKPSFDHRVLFSGCTKEEIGIALENFLQEEEACASRPATTSKMKTVMIFPGQGSQWIGMGKELLEKEPVFRNAIEACEQAFKPFTDWSLTEQLLASAAQSRLHEIDVIQPSLFAMQIALAQLWMSRGIVPDAVAGHSMGEVAAAHIAGALTLADAARIICTRSKLMKTVSGKGGAMAVTELSFDDAQTFVQQYPQLSIAVNNSPKSTVLSGDATAMDEIMAVMESKNLFCRRVKVDVASHSQQMDPLKADLYQALQPIAPAATAIPFYSTVRNKIVEGDALKAAYWVENLRSTVQFATAMAHLMHDGHTVFVEVSPHPVLINAIHECADHYRAAITSIASLYREKPEQQSFYKNFGDLYTQGYPISWQKYYGTHHAPHVQLPSYPFQRERFELEDKSAEREGRRGQMQFPLLGNALALAGTDNIRFWETQISIGTFPYLQDHQVNETVILPGAAYVELVLQAVYSLEGNRLPVITHLKFLKSISLRGDEVHTIQLKLTKEDKVTTFACFAKVTQSAGNSSWELLAEGTFKTRPARHENPLLSSWDSFSETTPGPAYYKSLRALGLHYGPYFQGLKALHRSRHSPQEVHFRVAVDHRIRQASAQYRVHPALLDACLQPLFYAATQDVQATTRTTFLTEIEEIHFYGTLDYNHPLDGIATLHVPKRDKQRGLTDVSADITIYTHHGVCVLRIKGLKGKIIDTALADQRREKLKNWLYQVNWVKADTVPAALPAPQNNKGAWVILGDPYGVSSILVSKMQAQRIACIHVTPGTVFAQFGPQHYAINYGSAADFKRLFSILFADGEQKITGVLHAASMSYTWQDPYLTADVVEEQQVYGSISFMHLHQQLSALKLRESPQLMIVTNGIHVTGPEQDVAQPVHSPLWGIAKVMFNELTHYNGRYFDLSANPSPEELDQIVTAMSATGTKENEIAFRGTTQYVPRLCEYVDEEIVVSNPSVRFSAEATYLVTGFRGLGFVFIEWMIRQGARHFALVSRSGETSAYMGERMTLLEAQGCSFSIFCADTGNYQALKDVLDTIAVAMPPLKGIVHAAGVIEARSLTDLNAHEFLRILNPKVKGAWNLHLLTQHLPLDCFIMFSSASTLIGLSGQGSYVAANAFLDTLAHSRRRMGLPGMSINWGVIQDVGMVANAAELERYARAEGFTPVSIHDAMEVFNDIYTRDHTQIGIVKLDPHTMARYYSSLAQTRYFNGLLAKEEDNQPKEINFSDHFLSLSTEEEKMAALEQLVTRHVAKIIKTSPARINASMTFKGLGIDSLMAIQLRNLLEKSLSLKLSVAMFWSHPSIHEFCSYLYYLLAEQKLIEKLEQAEKPQITVPTLSDWFVIPKPKPDANTRLFCFHDAGGNSTLYHGWEDLVDDSIELVLVELPGRGKRISEKTYASVDHVINDLLPALKPLLDKRALFFGHSMGSLIAFELVRALRRTHHTLPALLFVSSAPGLAIGVHTEVNPADSDEALIRRFPHLDMARLGDRELQQLLLKLLRDDLQLIHHYRYTPETPLNIPIVTIHGESDPRVRKEQAGQWKTETLAWCKVISRPGGHGYIRHDATFLTRLIGQEWHELATDHVLL